MIFGGQTHQVGLFLILGGKDSCFSKLGHRLTNLRQYSFELCALELAQLRVYIGSPGVGRVALSHSTIYRIFGDFE